MANAYHNLAGWLRDVRAVLGDEGYPLADSYYWELRQYLDELIAATPLDGDDEPVPEELEPEDADGDMAVQRSRDSSPPRTQSVQPARRSTPPVGRSARVGDTLARDSQTQEGEPGSGTPPLARTGLGVKRAAFVEVPLREANASVPRETPSRVSKRKLTPRPKRGKSQTSSRGRGKVRR